MEALVHGLIDAVNGVLWNYVLIALLLGAGAWFTLRFRMIQLKALFLSMKLVGSKGEPGSISSFQAFATGLASRVGTGNIAGVAVALTVGGPGAIFWMWMTALVGMSSAFVEATLAQIFKVSHPDGSYRGGPAYYIQTGLRSRGFGVLFSLSLILAFGFVFNAVQANAIADAFHTSFGWSRETVGLGLVLLSAPIIFGGIRRIATVAQVIVPLMAIGYLALAVYAVATHIALVPGVIALIVKSAFGLEQAAGGLTGYAVSQAIAIGVKRGLFSNEAGMGSAPNAAATASTRHPVTQGLIQMLGVFVDTIVICSATAFVILLSGQYELGTGMEGAALTQRAISSHVGDWGGIYMAVAIFFLAFSSVIGNYAYAEGNVEFITKRRGVLPLFRVAVLGMVMFGSVGQLPLVWAMADTSMGLMAIINLIAILALGKYAHAAWADYRRQRAAGVTDPVFTRNTIPELARVLPADVWGEHGPLPQRPVSAGTVNEVRATVRES
ncbi:alanine/glycine:cation symporter family protein [Burkholderia stabilis]|uniref:alanine/glycine:cation symporter family protein n=1 Tax=Burkholderia stabilis TaxID=95485 RepID=UPI00158D6F7C|nr:alanine/glycine:cation symporter family protein [Burkholderia stabilis]HDR9495605.1 alanine:cation symporter family protein [Burkholderia stabilis]HDR9527219.1 alanine:cation symporter family protein [Burkholderia stabilis]HDR9533783.1 alanine:cation symporter family protein [Burkholderia stabilis]HDR9540485.1 alanine:cation symporter family protein [Burkholderia stabilis]HDR9547831.1 alanine:cation symporter family protein [Burkholderia stabilis]